MAVRNVQWSLLSFLLLLPVLLSFAPKGAVHPFYVSVTEVVHNRQSASMEVTCRMFADDLEEVLRAGGSAKVDLTADNEANNARIKSYVARHLSLQADGKALNLQFVGYEKVKESVYCYLEVPGVTQPRRVDATASLLQDLTDKQINILHVTVGGQRQSRKMDYPVKAASFQF